MMESYTVSILVRNQFGVLNRVTSALRRRQLNLSHVLVYETELKESSRVVLQSHDPRLISCQFLEQLQKLPDVYSVQAGENTEENETADVSA